MKRFFLTFIFLSLTIYLLAGSIVRIGVMLPFKNGQAKSIRAIEFYRGLLMAADSLKGTGTSFRFYTYNTADKPIETVLKDTIIPHLDLVFAPDDAHQLQAITQFVAPYGTKVANCFNPNCNIELTSPNMFVLYPSAAFTAQQAASLFSRVFPEKSHLIIIDTQQIAHPLIADLKSQVKKVRYLHIGCTTSEIESRLSKNQPNVFVFSSNDLQTATATLNQIALCKKINHEYDIRILAYPEWISALDGILSNQDIYIYTSYYNNVNTARNQNFLRQYTQNFHQPVTDLTKSGIEVGVTPNENKNTSGAVQPVMAMFGFDAGYYMLKAIARYGKDYAGESIWAAPLQNSFTFLPVGSTGGYVNGNVLYIHRQPTGTIELIQQK